jgi:hypothetical protein
MCFGENDPKYSIIADEFDYLWSKSRETMNSENDVKV